MTTTDRQAQAIRNLDRELDRNTPLVDVTPAPYTIALRERFARRRGIGAAVAAAEAEATRPVALYVEGTDQPIR